MTPAAIASGREFADSLGIDFYETSAKESSNVEQVICDLSLHAESACIDLSMALGPRQAFISLAGQIKNKNTVSSAPSENILNADTAAKKGCC